MTKIAFLGLGAMGARMAARLIEAGHDVTVWNRTPDRADALVSAGATWAETPRAAAEGAAFVQTILTDDKAARDVWLGDTGALSGLSPDAVAVESSTISPAWAAELAAAVRDMGAAFLDAPVAGSRPQAEAGELLFLAGGAPDTVDRFRPIATAMGKAVIHAGPAGQGVVLKMMVNALLGLQTAAMAEVLAYGAANGMNPAKALEFLKPTPLVSPAAALQCDKIVANDHAPLFTVDLLAKDLGYFLQDISAAPVIAATCAAYQAASKGGHGDKHMSAVALTLDG